MLQKSSLVLMAFLGLAAVVFVADPALAKRKPKIGLPLAPCAPLEPGSATPATTAPGTAAAPAVNPNCGPFAVDPELVALRERVIGLEASNRSLTSALEDGKFQLTQARNARTEDRRVIADLSARNVSLQNEFAAAQAEIVRLQQLLETSGVAADAAPAAAIAPETEPASRAGPETAGASRSGPRALASPPAEPAASAPAAATPKDAGEAALTRARNLLVNEDYAGAEKVLGEFLGSNGTHVLAADAQYYLGEARYLRGGAFVEAAEAYLKVVKSYPKSARAPDSFVKLAASLRQLGEKQRACDTLVEFAKRYPKAPAAVRTRAASEGRAAGCTQ